MAHTLWVFERGGGMLWVVVGFMGFGLFLGLIGAVIVDLKLNDRVHHGPSYCLDPLYCDRVRS